MNDLMHTKWKNFSTLKTFSKTSRSLVELVRQDENGKIFVKKTLYAKVSPYRLLQKSPIPGIPRILALDTQEGTTIVLEEFIHGQTLEQILETTGRVDDSTAAAWMLQLCFILQKVHALCIVHRDIKPSNIMISPNNLLYLIDFDTSRFSGADKSGDTVCLGTKGYAAPEQYGYAQTDERTDLYAMGVLFNQLLTGKFPDELLYRGKLGQIIQRCILIDPKQRFQNANQIILLLKALYFLTPEPKQNCPSPYSQPTVPPNPATKNIRPMIICSLLTLCLAWLDFSNSSFLYIGDTILAYLQHLFLLLPPVAFASDLFYIRSRPILPTFRQKPKHSRYALYFFLLWFGILIAFSMLCTLLYSPQAHEMINIG